MAYGDLIGAEPIDLGNGVPAYNFVSRGGQKTMLWGPEAEQLKARLDASESMMPQKTAQLDVSGETAPDVFGTGIPAATPPPPRMGQTEMLTGPPPKQAGVREVVSGNGETVTLPVQSNGDVVRPPGQSQQQQGPVRIGYNSRLVPNPEGGPPIMQTYHPGSSGVSQEDLQRKRAQTVMMPSGTRTTVEGAVPPDPEFVKGMEEMTWERRRQIREATDNAIAMNEEQRKLVQAQYERDTAAVQEQERLRQLTEQRVQQFEQTKNKLRADANSAKVNPRRLFSGELGTLRTIGAAIASAMGQYGAARAHTPNTAQQIIDGAIDRDIQAQQIEIQTKKEAADNALSEYLREGLSLDQAKLVLKQNMRDQATSQRRLIDLTNAPKEIWAWNEQMDLAERQNQLMFEEDYRRKSLGRTTEEIAATARYPQAGSPGGWRESTPTEAKGAMDATKAMRVAYNEMKGEGGGGGGNPTERNLLSAIGEFEQINSRVAAKDPNARVPGYEQQGLPSRIKWKLDDWWGGEGTHMSGLTPEEQKDYELYMQSRNSALFSLSQGRGQGVVRESELRLSMQELQSAKNWGSVQRIRQHQTDAIRARLQAVQSGRMTADESINTYRLTLGTGTDTEAETESQ